MMKSFFERFRIKKQQVYAFLLLFIVLYTQNSCTSSRIEPDNSQPTSAPTGLNAVTKQLTTKPLASTPTQPAEPRQQNSTNQPTPFVQDSLSPLNSPLASPSLLLPLTTDASVPDTDELQTAVEQLTELLEEQIVPLTILSPSDPNTPFNEPVSDIAESKTVTNNDIVADFLVELVTPTSISATASLSTTISSTISTTSLSSLIDIGATTLSTLTVSTSYLPLFMKQETVDALPPAVSAASESFSPVPPLPTPDSVLRVANIPILMYHYLSVPPAGADIYRRDLSVAPDLFARHLDSMLEAGYQTISLYELTMHLTNGAPLPAKSVVITFDDGYRDNYENAFPLLLARGMTATFFISPEFIELRRPEYADWSMLRTMYAAGMSIEAHGLNHRSLKNRDVDFLAWQALASIQAIEREMGERPRFVSYPAGEYDNLTIEVFRNSHFWAGTTTVQGTTQRSEALFSLHRVRVRNTTQPGELIRLMGLDW